MRPLYILNLELWTCFRAYLKKLKACRDNQARKTRTGMDPADPTQTAQQAEKPAKKRGRKRRFTIGVWMILTNLVLLVFAVYASLAITERAVPAPDWVAQRFEAEVNAALPQGRLSVGRIALSVSDGGLPAMQLVNLGIFDDRGSEIARLNRVGVRFGSRGLIRGEPRPRHLELSGAQITLRRTANGEFDLSLGGGEAASGSLTTVLDAIDQVFLSEYMNDVVDVTAGDLTITLEDARSGRLWQITQGELDIERRANRLDYSVRFDVFNGTEELAETNLNIRSTLSSSAVTIGAQFTNATARDIALQSPILAFLGVLDAPISGAMRSRFSGAGDLLGIDATLEIGQGALKPSQTADPIGFDRAKAYFSFDPDDQKLTFSELSVEGPSLTMRAEARAYLRDFAQGWPQTLLAQMQLSEMTIRPANAFGSAINFQGGAADMRVRLDPFAVDFGQLSLITDEERLQAKGRVQLGASGWQASADLFLDQMSIPRLLRLWPEDYIAKTRIWFAENVASGTIENLHLAMRQTGQAAPDFELGFGYRDADIQVMPDFPTLRAASGYGAVQGRQVTLVVEEGHMQSPNEGRVELAGTSFQVPDTSQRPATASLNLQAWGASQDVMSIVALPPINALKGSALAPDFATGDMALWGEISYPMMRDRPKGSLKFNMGARITNAASDVLVPGKILRAAQVDVAVNNDGITVSGPMRVDDVAGTLTWAKAFGEGAAPISQLSGHIDLGQKLSDAFNLGFPAGTFSQQASGHLEVTFAQDTPPAFVLTSDLVGLGMGLAEIGWQKPASETGKLRVTGTLGAQAGVSDFQLESAGLSITSGTVELSDDGRFAQARLGALRIGDWFEGPVRVVGRGPGATPGIEVLGGRLDLRRADFSAQTGGNGGPVDVTLDALQVSSGITLTALSGALDTRNGLSGRFQARVNGGAAVQGQLETMTNGVGLRMTSGNGGKALSDAGILTSARGGALDLTLRPNAGGSYAGTMVLSDVNVRSASVLTELLSAVSVVGLLDQLRGAGIVFTRVEAAFNLSKDRLRLRRSSAVGPSLGVSMDGDYDFASGQMNMQGVVSPVYFLNAIGQALSPRKGEGLFGFNFRLSGDAARPRVQVNPLSILTPGAFRDIFRSQPPQGSQ